jgi:hypothetical protein
MAAGMNVQHEKWLTERRLNGLRLPRIYENLYSGFIAAALLGDAAPRAATLAALIPVDLSCTMQTSNISPRPRVGLT